MNFVVPSIVEVSVNKIMSMFMGVSYHQKIINMDPVTKLGCRITYFALEAGSHYKLFTPDTGVSLLYSSLDYS